MKTDLKRETIEAIQRLCRDAKQDVGETLAGEDIPHIKYFGVLGRMEALAADVIRAIVRQR